MTGSAEPLIDAGWLRPGCHVNAIGSSTPGGCEVGPDLIAAAEVFVDDTTSALALAGEFTRLPAPPAVTPLGAVLAGLAPGRSGASAVTLFKSVGGGLQDLALLDLLFPDPACHN